MDKALVSGLLVGSAGDASLQVFLQLTDKDYGLKKYFAQHGRLESIFIAGSMIQTLSAPYYLIDPSMNYLGLAVYGAGLDVAFRQYHMEIFPSLEDYYKKVDPIWSAVWGAIPMMMVGAIYRML